MNTLGPLILLALAFALLLLGRIVILLVLRAGETTKPVQQNRGKQPTVIRDDLFADTTNENTP